MASIPVTAATESGIVTESCGSKMATLQAAFLSPQAIFICVSALAIKANDWATALDTADPQYQTLIVFNVHVHHEQFVSDEVLGEKEEIEKRYGVKDWKTVAEGDNSFRYDQESSWKVAEKMYADVSDLGGFYSEIISLYRRFENTAVRGVGDYPLLAPEKKLNNVVIHGNKAEGQITSPTGFQEPGQFVKLDGRWYIEVPFPKKSSE